MKKKKYTKEFLEPLVKNSKSYSEVIRKSGAKVSGGSFRAIKHWISYYCLDISHFEGQAWCRGEKQKDRSEARKSI